jgi:SET domain
MSIVTSMVSSIVTGIRDWITTMGRTRVSRANVLKHLQQDVYCRLGVSSIHGVGVFAVRHIPKGAHPFKLLKPDAYVYIAQAELHGVEPGVMKLIDQFCYCVDGVYEIPKTGFNTISLAVYLNHSKTPNIKMLDEAEFVALTDIAAGTELTMDYDDSFNEEHVFDNTDSGIGGA